METPDARAGTAFRLPGSALSRIQGSEFAQNGEHATTAFGKEAVQGGAVKRTAAEPVAFGSGYPRTFGDVLGISARHRDGPVCRYLMTLSARTECDGADVKTAAGDRPRCCIRHRHAAAFRCVPVCAGNPAYAR